MTTTVNNPQKPFEKGKSTRLVGTIMKEPEQFTSKTGKDMLRLKVLVDPGLGDEAKVWWNATMMLDLANKVGPEVIKKFGYAKFTGLGSSREWEKDGKSGVSHDILITGVELQSGQFIKNDKPEDAPF